MLLYADFKRVNEGLENHLRDNLRFRVVVFVFLMVASMGWSVKCGAKFQSGKGFYLEQRGKH